MTPLPRHGNPAGDATLAIQKLARRTGADVQELMTIHVLEALLVRLARSTHPGDFVLKGGASHRWYRLHTRADGGVCRTTTPLRRSK